MEKLREQYEKEVVPALMKKFNYKSVMQVPKLDKIVINIGLGDTKENPKSLSNAWKVYETKISEKVKWKGISYVFNFFECNEKEIEYADSQCP